MQGKPGQNLLKELETIRIHVGTGQRGGSQQKLVSLLTTALPKSDVIIIPPRENRPGEDDFAREIVWPGLGMQLELDSTQLRILEDKCEQRAP